MTLTVSSPDGDTSSQLNQDCQGNTPFCCTIGGIATVKNISVIICQKHPMGPIQINGNYALNGNANVRIFGTDSGEMTLTVTHQYEDSSSETYIFQNVPLTDFRPSPARSRASRDGR